MTTPEGDTARERVHAARPGRDDQHCAVCMARIHRIDGGKHVHSDSGAVAAPGPDIEMTVATGAVRWDDPAEMDRLATEAESILPETLISADPRNGVSLHELREYDQIPPRDDSDRMGRSVADRITVSGINASRREWTNPESGALHETSGMTVHELPPLPDVRGRAVSIPGWVHEFARLADGWSPEIINGHDGVYLSIPLAPLGSWVALEIEASYSSEGPYVSTRYVMTVRAWDRTGGMTDETECGIFSREGVLFVLPNLLAGIRAMGEREVQKERDDERRQAEDEAAQSAGGYVS